MNQITGGTLMDVQNLKKTVLKNESGVNVFPIDGIGNWFSQRGTGYEALTGTGSVFGWKNPTAGHGSLLGSGPTDCRVAYPFTGDGVLKDFSGGAVGVGIRKQPLSLFAVFASGTKAWSAVGDTRQVITGRICSEGDGVETSFSFYVGTSSVRPSTFTLIHTEGGSQRTGTDNGSGVLSGTNIASGTLNYETGLVSVTLTNPADLGTSIAVTYTVDSWVSLEEAENVGEGTGAQTVYTLLELANGGVKERSFRLKAQIGASEYFFVDDGAGTLLEVGGGGMLSSGSINYATGDVAITFTSAPADNSVISVTYQRKGLNKFDVTHADGTGVAARFDVEPTNGSRVILVAQAAVGVESLGVSRGLLLLGSSGVLTGMRTLAAYRDEAAEGYAAPERVMKVTAGQQYVLSLAAKMFAGAGSVYVRAWTGLSGAGQQVSIPAGKYEWEVLDGLVTRIEDPSNAGTFILKCAVGTALSRFGMRLRAPTGATCLSMELTSDSSNTYVGQYAMWVSAISFGQGSALTAFSDSVLSTCILRPSEAVEGQYLRIGPDGTIVGADIEAAEGGGGGITSLNGLTSPTQTLAIGTTGTAPTFNSVGATHTLNIPLASASTNVTGGLITGAEFVSLSEAVKSINLATNATQTLSATTTTTNTSPTVVTDTNAGTHSIQIPMASASTNVSAGLLSSGEFIALSQKAESAIEMAVATGHVVTSGDVVEILTKDISLRTPIASTESVASTIQIPSGGDDFQVKMLSGNAGVLVYRTATGSNIRGISFSIAADKSVTWGTDALIASAVSGSYARVCKAAEDKFFVFYTRNSDSYGCARAISIAAGVMTVGSEQVFISTATSNIACDFLETDKAVFHYYTSSGTNSYVRVITASGTTVSFGGQQTLETIQNVGIPKIERVSATKALVVNYTYNGVVYQLKYSMLTISGTSVSFTTPTASKITANTISSAYLTTDKVLLFASNQYALIDTSAATPTEGTVFSYSDTTAGSFPIVVDGKLYTQGASTTYGNGFTRYDVNTSTGELTNLETIYVSKYYGSYKNILWCSTHSLFFFLMQARVTRTADAVAHVFDIPAIVGGVSDVVRGGVSLRNMTGYGGYIASGIAVLMNYTTGVGYSAKRIKKQSGKIFVDTTLSNTTVIPSLDKYFSFKDEFSTANILVAHAINGSNYELRIFSLTETTLSNGYFTSFGQGSGHNPFQLSSTKPLMAYFYNNGFGSYFMLTMRIYANGNTNRATIHNVAASHGYPCELSDSVFSFSGYASGFNSNRNTTLWPVFDGFFVVGPTNKFNNLYSTIDSVPIIASYGNESVNHFAYKNILCSFSGSSTYMQVWRFIPGGMAYLGNQQNTPSGNNQYLSDGAAVYRNGTIYSLGTDNSSGFLYLWSAMYTQNNGLLWTRTMVGTNVSPNVYSMHLHLDEDNDRLIGTYVDVSGNTRLMVATLSSEYTFTITISGTLIESSTTGSRTASVLLDSTHLLVRYLAGSTAYVRVIEISSSGIVTLGTAQSVPNAVNGIEWKCLAKISSTKALTSYWGATTNCIRVLDISGTSITVGSEVTIPSATGATVSVDYDPVTQNAVYFGWGSGTLYHGRITISGSTPTVAYASSTSVATTPGGQVKLFWMDNRTFVAVARDSQIGSNALAATNILINDSNQTTTSTPSSLSSLVWAYTSPSICKTSNGSLFFFGFYGGSNYNILLPYGFNYTESAVTTIQDLSSSMASISIYQNRPTSNYFIQTSNTEWRAVTSSGIAKITLSGATLSAVNYPFRNQAFAGVTETTKFSDDASEFLAVGSNVNTLGISGSETVVTSEASYLEIQNRLIGYAKESGVSGESVIVDVGPFIDGSSLLPGATYYIDRNTGFNTTSGTEIGVAVSATKLKLKTFI